jgi:hypothetical protein
MPISIHASCRDSDARMYELGSAIANRLHADYMPTLAEPLTRELKDLIARLVALEESPAGGGLLLDGETTSSVLPRFERSCGRPTNRVLAKAANRTTDLLLCMQLGFT